MARRHNQPDYDYSWPLIIAAFVLVWPVGLLLLFRKLFADDHSGSYWQAPPLQSDYKVQRTPPRQRPRNKAARAVNKVTKSPADKKSTARWLKIVGAVLLFVGVGGLADAVESMFWASSWWWLEDLLGSLAFGAAGGGMLFKGFSMDRQMKRFSRYLLVMGDREAVAIDELARTLGYSSRRVEKDLEKMIDRGYFGGRAYLNQELGYLFRSSGAGEAFRQRAAEEEAREERREPAGPPKETEEGYSGILRNIRRVNDRIADPILSAKIDRLEEITAKIFRIVEQDPKKAGKIDTFLNYYLPTTQKLLDSYAEFEAAGVEGENLRQAKQRIENTMDSIVKGFEHQLDELYKAEAMDVASDIRVMEHMLRRDTGTVEQDFGLGGSAVQRAPEEE